MVFDDGEADRPGVPGLAELIDEDQVAETLRHLLAVLVDQRGVHPVLHERLARGGLGLRTFALVVREDQIGSPAVQVDGGTELTQGECRTLDVPTGSARAPHGVPAGLVGGGRVPQHEVER